MAFVVPTASYNARLLKSRGLCLPKLSSAEQLCESGGLDVSSKYLKGQQLPLQSAFHSDSSDNSWTSRRKFGGVVYGRGLSKLRKNLSSVSEHGLFSHGLLQETFNFPTIKFVDIRSTLAVDEDREVKQDMDEAALQRFVDERLSEDTGVAFYKYILLHAMQPLHHFETTLMESSVNSPSTSSGSSGKDPNPEFNVNLGRCIETLRNELPHFFGHGITYDIYTEDVVFREGENSLQGLRLYKTLIWSLRFHARMLFNNPRLEVRRIHQPDVHTIVVRWCIRGTWRVSGGDEFMDGCSVYKVNRDGFIYEHEIDNVIKIDAYLAPLQRLWVLPETSALSLTPAQFSLNFFEQCVLPSIAEQARLRRRNGPRPSH